MSSPFTTDQDQSKDWSLTQASKVSVAVTVSPPPSEASICIFPLVENGNDQDDVLLDYARIQQSYPLSDSLIYVNPNALGKQIGASVTLQMSKLVAQSLHVETEDWARQFNFYSCWEPSLLRDRLVIASLDSDSTLIRIGGRPPYRQNNVEDDSFLGCSGFLGELLTKAWKSRMVVTMSLMEVVCEDEMKDLLVEDTFRTSRLLLRHYRDGAKVVDLTEVPVDSMQGLERALLLLQKRKRQLHGHFICTVKLYHSQTESPQTVTLVDLSYGTVTASTSTKQPRLYSQQQHEAKVVKSVKTSLSALRGVLRDLQSGKTNISFRECTLTKVLQRCLTRSQIVLWAHICPSTANHASSLSTLEYLHRLTLQEIHDTAKSPFHRVGAGNATRKDFKASKFSGDALLKNVLSDPRQRLAQVGVPTSPTKPPIPLIQDNDDYVPTDYMDIDPQMMERISSPSPRRKSSIREETSVLQQEVAAGEGTMRGTAEEMERAVSDESVTNVPQGPSTDDPTSTRRLSQEEAEHMLRELKAESFTSPLESLSPPPRTTPVTVANTSASSESEAARRYSVRNNEMDPTREHRLKEHAATRPEGDDNLRHNTRSLITTMEGYEATDPMEHDRIDHESTFAHGDNASENYPPRSYSARNGGHHEDDGGTTNDDGNDSGDTYSDERGGEHDSISGQWNASGHEDGEDHRSMGLSQFVSPIATKNESLSSLPTTTKKIASRTTTSLQLDNDGPDLSTRTPMGSTGARHTTTKTTPRISRSLPLENITPTKTCSASPDGGFSPNNETATQARQSLPLSTTATNKVDSSMRSSVGSATENVSSSSALMDWVRNNQERTDGREKPSSIRASEDGAFVSDSSLDDDNDNGSIGSISRGRRMAVPHLGPPQRPSEGTPPSRNRVSSGVQDNQDGSLREQRHSATDSSRQFSYGDYKDYKDSETSRHQYPSELMHEVEASRDSSRRRERGRDDVSEQPVSATRQRDGLVRDNSVSHTPIEMVLRSKDERMRDVPPQLRSEMRRLSNEESILDLRDDEIVAAKPAAADDIHIDHSPSSDVMDEISVLESVVDEVKRVHNGLYESSSLSLERLRDTYRSNQQDLRQAAFQLEQIEKEKALLRNQLQTKMQEQSDSEAQLEREILDLEARLSHAIDDRKAVEKIAEDAIASQDKLEHTITGLTQQLVTSRKETDELMSKHNHIVTSRDSLLNENDNLTDLVEKLQAERDELRQDNSQLVRDLRTLEDESSLAKTQVAQLQEKVQSFSQVEKLNGAELIAAREEISRLSQQKGVLALALEERDRGLSKTKETEKAFRTVKSEATSLRDELHRTRQLREKELSSMSESITDLQQERSHLASELSKMQSALETTRDKLAQTASERTEALARESELSEMVKGKDHEAKKLVRLVETLTRDQARDRDIIKSSTLECDRLRKTVAELEDGLRTDQEEATRGSQASQEESDNLRARLETLENERNYLYSRIESLRHQVSMEKKARMTAESSAAALRLEAEGRKESMDELQHDIRHFKTARSDEKSRKRRVQPSSQRTLGGELDAENEPDPIQTPHLPMDTSERTSYSRSSRALQSAESTELIRENQMLRSLVASPYRDSVIPSHPVQMVNLRNEEIERRRSEDLAAALAQRMKAGFESRDSQILRLLMENEAITEGRDSEVHRLRTKIRSMEKESRALGR